jgi:cytochrome c-type biogenesis protein CcmE
MSRKRRRMWLLLLCAIGLGSATALTLTAFQDNLVFFRSPSDIVAAQGGAGGGAPAPTPDRAFRLGGLVEPGSVERATGADGRPAARFRVTDGAHAIPVTYTGVLPDLFREGQGVVTLGKLGPDGVFRASEVLARHDETYMPPEVADALKRSGHWNPQQGAPPPASSWNTMTPERPASEPAPRSGS